MIARTGPPPGLRPTFVPIKQADETPERFEKYRKNYTDGLAGLIRDLTSLQDALLKVRYRDELSAATTALQLHDVL